MNPSVSAYRDAIRRGATPNIPPHLIEEVLGGLTESEVQNYMAQRRKRASL